MAGRTYDIITIGGGLAGSTLAQAMVKHGARVLVLEREQQFEDRVRGELLAPWDVAEAKALGVYDLLRTTCGQDIPWFAFSTEPGPGTPRVHILTENEQGMRL